VQANRKFLARAVRYLTGRPASGSSSTWAPHPAVDNTHQVAQREAPDSRIVYVDNDRWQVGLCTRAPDRSGCLKRTREQKRSERP